MASLARSARAATAKVARPLMQRWFPGTSHPLVISAPMDFVTNARLATEVTKAGGFGFIQGGRDFKPDSALVTKTLDERLSTARALLAGHLGSSRGNDHNATSTTSATTTLPLGVGFVAYDASALDHFNETTLPILVEHKPGVVWLFAPSPERPETIRKIVESLRKAADTSAAATGSNEAWDLRIAVQVGTVEAARKAVEDGADIIVAQGIDAGGHQFASGAGVVSLVPEIADMLAAMSRESHAREIALWAAGGIADGRGVAAALALGADAAVLGTRYMVAIESDTQDYKRQAILSTSDGGQNTVKAYIHDHVQGNHSWPEVYDGRALIHPSYMDHVAGMTLDENKALFKSARDGGELSRMVIWSGTGVGLIKKEQPAAEITREVREGALAAISRLK